MKRSISSAFLRGGYHIMKKTKVLSVAVGAVVWCTSLFGIGQAKQVTPSGEIEKIKSDSPIFFEDASPQLSTSDAISQLWHQSHYSHQSHQSHYSHQSHQSHQSSYPWYPQP